MQTHNNKRSVNGRYKVYRCEATTTIDLWDFERGPDKFHQCKRDAKVEVCGVKLCVTHAGPVAIMKLLELGDAKPLQCLLRGSLCDLVSDPIIEQKYYRDLEKSETETL